MSEPTLESEASPWSFVLLGSVCEVIAGQSPSGSAYNTDGVGLPFYQGKKEFTDRFLGPPTTWTTKVTKAAQRKDILMSVRAPVGPINEAVETICIGRGLAAIRAGEQIDQGFLWYALLWLQPQITGNAGAVFPSINRKQIENLVLPCPPLEEQKRIVAILDQAFSVLDRARAHAETNLADAQELFATSLESIFREAGSAGKKMLADAVHPDCTLSYGIVQPGDDIEDGLPIVRPVDLKQRTIKRGSLKRISPDRASAYARTRLVGGELLLCVRGSTGEVSVADAELKGANVTRGIVPIRFNPKEVLPEFAYFQFRSPLIRDQIVAKTYGAALMQINIKDVRTLSFLVPSISKQKEIVARLERLLERAERLRDNYESQLEDITTLRQSLLQQAFAGHL